MWPFAQVQHLLRKTLTPECGIPEDESMHILYMGNCQSSTVQNWKGTTAELRH